MLINYSVQIDMPELDSEIIEQIETAGEAASNDNSNIYLAVFICIFFLTLSYLLYFKYELIYKITESWKSYGSSDCSDLYIANCKIGAILLLFFVIYMIINLIFDFKFDFLGLFG